MRSQLFGLLLLSLLAGCAGGKVKVSGQVRYKGEPLPGGIVTFQPADKRFDTVAAILDEQGHYEVTLPVGEVRVAVDNRNLQPRSSGPPPALPAAVQAALKKAKTTEPPPAAPAKTENPSAPTKPSGKYIAIPEKYHTIEQSGLTFTVEPGNPKHDIELK